MRNESESPCFCGADDEDRNIIDNEITRGCRWDQEIAYRDFPKTETSILQRNVGELAQADTLNSFSNAQDRNDFTNQERDAPFTVEKVDWTAPPTMGSYMDEAYQYGSPFFEESQGSQEDIYRELAMSGNSTMLSYLVYFDYEDGSSRYGRL